MFVKFVVVVSVLFSLRSAQKEYSRDQLIQSGKLERPYIFKPSATTPGAQSAAAVCRKHTSYICCIRARLEFSTGHGNCLRF